MPGSSNTRSSASTNSRVQPGNPDHPFVTGHHGDLAEVVAMLARELDLLPGHIQGVAHHVAQIQQQIHAAHELDVVLHLLLEFLVIRQREFAHDGNGNQLALRFDGNHFSLLTFNLTAQMPAATVSAMPLQATTGMASRQMTTSRIPLKTTVL
jgi:hypothetical protein